MKRWARARPPTMPVCGTRPGTVAELEALALDEVAAGYHGAVGVELDIALF